MARSLSLGKDKSPPEGEFLWVSGVVGYTIESKAGSGRPIRWRLPALVLAVTACAVVYFFTRPYCQVAGTYDGYIGGEVSSNKTHLFLNLRQDGTNLAGSCDLSHQTANRVIVRHAELTGTAGANSFRVSGSLEKVTIFFEGQPHHSPSKGPQVIGVFWQVGSGGPTDPAPFQGNFLNGRVSPQDLSIRKKKRRD